LVEDLKNYDIAKFSRDLSAGVTVGVVALPLAMAFAVAPGLQPRAGIFTAIIAGFLILALGGSRVQIGGPAGAFIVVVYGIIEKYGLASLLISTIFASVLLFAMGMLRLGSLIRYVLKPDSLRNPLARISEHPHPWRILTPGLGTPGMLNTAEYALRVRHQHRESSIGCRDGGNALR
jgi:hypothetical protein